MLLATGRYIGEGFNDARLDTLLGIEVNVEKLDMDSRDNIVAVCGTNYAKQSVRVVDLRLPHPAPAGAEWIEAYRLWYNRG